MEQAHSQYGKQQDSQNKNKRKSARQKTSTVTTEDMKEKLTIHITRK